MHPLSTQASGITHDVIGAAIEAHKEKGPGLLESIYELCLTMELQLRGHQVSRQDTVDRVNRDDATLLALFAPVQIAAKRADGELFLIRPKAKITSS